MIPMSKNNIPFFDLPLAERLDAHRRTFVEQSQHNPQDAWVNGVLHITKAALHNPTMIFSSAWMQTLVRHRDRRLTENQDEHSAGCARGLYLLREVALTDMLNPYLAAGQVRVDCITGKLVQLQGTPADLHGKRRRWLVLDEDNAPSYVSDYELQSQYALVNITG